jgi:hypothetical protein
MNNIQVERLFTIDSLSPRSFWNRCRGTKRDRELTTIHPLTIEAGLKDVLVIAEATAPEGTMELFRSPVSFSVRAIRAVTWTNRWRNGTRMIDKSNNILP